MLNGQLIPATSNRALRGFALRTQTAGADAFPIAPAQIDNGDEALYADKSGTYTKGVLQSGIGLVDLAAYQSFKNALSSGGLHGRSMAYIPRAAVAVARPQDPTVRGFELTTPKRYQKSHRPLILASLDVH
jgi:hypothetical protein